MQEIIKSNFHHIAISLTGLDEPNNGRILHIADIVINGRIQNSQYFDNWNRLDERLDKLVFDSPGKDFVFIPAEAGGFLINTLTLEKVALPYKKLSTFTFIGNCFINSLLIIVHIDELIIFNTVSEVSARFDFAVQTVTNFSIINNTSLSIICSNRAAKTNTTKVFSYSDLINL